jgi:type IV secretion system protein VirB11
VAEPIKLHTPRDEQARRLQESMRRQLGDYCRFLDDPEVVEISLNPDNKVWVDRLGEPLQCVGSMQPEAAETFIGTVAATVRLVINYEHPSLKCRLPIGGSRFQAACPPTTPAWVFSIRRHASVVFPLADYEARGIITDLQHQAIEEALKNERNILVTGGTGSGKTTLVNSLLAHPDVSKHRLIICEDTPELLWAALNVVSMQTNDAASMRDLVVQAMRLRPDRLIIGETRDGASLLEALKAWGTGHKGGITTLHANNARHALSSRMEMLIREVSADPLRDLISESIEVIIHIEKIDRDPFRKVTEVSALRGYRGGRYELQPLA